MDEEQLQGVRRWMDSYRRCCAVLAAFDAGVCTNRGMIGPHGEPQHDENEATDVACVAARRKPLALVLPGSEAHRLAVDCGLFVEAPPGGHGPVLACTRANRWRAVSARRLLPLIGAWRDADAPTPPLCTSLQAHMALGLLLGYPVDDVFGLHHALGGDRAALARDARGALVVCLDADARRPFAVPVCVAAVLAEEHRESAQHST